MIKSLRKSPQDFVNHRLFCDTILACPHGINQFLNLSKYSTMVSFSSLVRAQTFFFPYAVITFEILLKILELIYWYNKNFALLSNFYWFLKTFFLHHSIFVLDFQDQPKSPLTHLKGLPKFSFEVVKTR